MRRGGRSRGVDQVLGACTCAKVHDHHAGSSVAEGAIPGPPAFTQAACAALSGFSCVRAAWRLSQGAVRRGERPRGAAGTWAVHVH